MQVRGMLCLTTTIFLTACATTPGPGAPGYAYNVSGPYTGRLMVEGQPFDATLELRTARGGRVSGTFRVRSPLEIDGRVDGVVIDDLLRVTITYRNNARVGCSGRIEGILTIDEGGGIVAGPVTISDCEDLLPGSMSFRR